MVWIVETKVFRHVIDRDRQFVEVPVRVRFEYGVIEASYQAGTIEYETLYNEAAVLRRFPTFEPDDLAAAVDATVRRSLDEELRFAGLLSHGNSLFDTPPSAGRPADRPADECADAEGQPNASVSPPIFMPPARSR